MKPRKYALTKIVLGLLLATAMLIGCSSTSKDVKESDGYSEYCWDKYVKNQPKKEIKPIEVEEVDRVRFTICDIYKTTGELAVSYDEKVKNSAEYHQWLKLTETMTEEERDNFWNNKLNPIDREAILKFNQANEETYAKAVSMLPKALELLDNIKKLDFKQVSKKAGMNVFKARSIISGLDDSKDQIVYTVEVLKLMKDEYNMYQKFKNQG